MKLAVLASEGLLEGHRQGLSPRPDWPIRRAAGAGLVSPHHLPPTRHALRSILSTIQVAFCWPGGALARISSTYLPGRTQEGEEGRSPAALLPCACGHGEHPALLAIRRSCPQLAQGGYGAQIEGSS